MAELKTLSTIDTSPFKRLVLNLGATPTVFTEGMAYYELLAWLVKFLEDEVVPKTNESIEGLKELQTYVSTYFDNLDVQEEINNKLDDMTEDGTLQAIIESYINLNALIVYDTLADLKSSESLIAGVTVRTLGYHTKGDGGSAIYRIREVTNQDTEDDRIIVPITNNVDLIAEFVPLNSELFAEQFGAYGDGTNDDTTAINAAITYCKENKVTLKVNKTYKITSSLDVNTSGLLIEGNRTYKNIDDNTPNPTFVWTGSGYLFEAITFAEGLKIKNISITGNETNSGIHDTGFRNVYENITFYKLVNGIYFENTSGTWRGEETVKGCLFESCSNTGILIAGTVDSEINNNIFKGGGNCVKGSFLAWMFVENHDYSDLGMEVTAGVHSQILNNYFDHSTHLPHIKITPNNTGAITINNNKFLVGSTTISNPDNSGFIDYVSTTYGQELSVCNNVTVGSAQNIPFINILNDITARVSKFSINGNLISTTCNKLVNSINKLSIANSPNLTIKLSAANLTGVNKNTMTVANGYANIILDITNAPASITLPFEVFYTTYVPILNVTDSTTGATRIGDYINNQFVNNDILYIPSTFQGKRIIINACVPIYRGNDLT